MKVIRCRHRDFETFLRDLDTEGSLFDAEVESRVQAIIEEVRTGGDAALVKLTERFDHARVDASHLAVSTAELMAASLKAGPELRRTIRSAIRNIGRFSRRSMRRPWKMRNAEGAEVGEKFDPFERVGLYVPGGKAPLVSSALMTVALARVAGCREIVVCSPCGPDGAISPTLLYAVRAAGATEIYRLGGAQAIAGMALGTRTIRPVQKIFGPGNSYVVTAKRLLFGRVAVDLLPGPSEVLVLADDSARPAWVAADLLAQAEHGSGDERVWLVTTSRPLLTAVQREIRRQIPHRPRREWITAALERNGALIYVPKLEQAVQVANRLAPEHCEVMTRQAARVSEGILTAGAIFLGPWSPTVTGDYLAGPSHTLPTGGGGRSFPGLTVDQFQRRTSVVRYDRASLRRSLPVLREFATLEGLEAHGRSAEIRFGK